MGLKENAKTEIGYFLQKGTFKLSVEEKILSKVFLLWFYILFFPLLFPLLLLLLFVRNEKWYHVHMLMVITQNRLGN